MTEVLKLEFCKIEVYFNYLVVIVDEGQTINMQKSQNLIKVAKSLFPKKPFVYITNRINSYAVDPSVYKPASQIENLAGFCVVSSNFMAKTSAEIERLFMQKPFAICDTMKEALEWKKTILGEN